MESANDRPDAPSAGSIVFLPFRLDVLSERLWHGDRLVALRPKAFAILKCLLEQPGQLVTQQELRARLWGKTHVGEGVLKTQIAELRQALGDCARTPLFIETAHRRGYRFIGQIERGASAPDSVASASPLVMTAHPACADYFVGRDAELEFLAACWKKAARGERQVVFVTGEAGVGKTALVNAFLRQLVRAESDSVATWGQCIAQYGSGEPYLPLIDALRRSCAERGGHPIAALLRQHAPAWLPVLPSLQTSQPTNALHATAATLPGRMLREMVEALEVLAQRRPVVLLIEDLHWADYSTLDLLAHLAVRSDPVRLFVLGTFRPVEASKGRLAEVVATLQAHGRCMSLLVPHLSERAVGEYLACRFAQHRLPNTVRELIHRRTEGNALYMVGVVDGWLDRGLLKAADEHCELLAGLDELAHCVPDSFVRMVESELGRLNPLERSVLEAASVAGNEFSTAAVAAALSADIVQIEEICVRWSRSAQFLRSSGTAEWNDGTIAERCQFIHVLYQQVTYSQLGAARRAQLHLRIGERLELGYGEGAESFAAELALHFQLGRDYVRALRYLRSAGERALRSSAYHEAIDHLTLALELLETRPETTDRTRIELDLLLLLASPLRITKGYAAPELERAYARAGELCERGASTAQLLLVLAGMGAFHLVRSAYRAGLEVGQKLLQLAQDAGDAGARAEAHLVIGGACHFLGQQPAAERHLAQAVAFHESSQGISYSNMTSLDHGGAARGMLAHSYWMLGYPDRARAEVEKSLQRARTIYSPVATAYALNFAASICLLCRDFAAAREYAEQLAKVAGECGLEMFAASPLLHEGVVRVQLGDVAGGIEMIRRGWAAYTATGTRAYGGYWVCALAQAHGLLGQTEAALQILDEAHQVNDSHRELLWDAELFRIRGELLFRSEVREVGSAQANAGAGEMSLPAESCLLRALEIAQEQSAKLLELRAAISLSRYWQARGEGARARVLLSDVCAWFTEQHDGPDPREARALLEELGK